MGIIEEFWGDDNPYPHLGRWTPDVVEGLDLFSNTRDLLRSTVPCDSAQAEAWAAVDPPTGGGLSTYSVYNGPTRITTTGIPPSALRGGEIRLEFPVWYGRTTVASWYAVHDTEGQVLLTGFFDAPRTLSVNDQLFVTLRIT